VISNSKSYRQGEKVRVAVIGTSWYADALHLPSITSHPNATVTAICGRDPARAGAMASKFNIPHIYADYRELIRSGLVDAVVIATPDDLHHAMTLAAVDAGLHVICEKPLALNAADAREMAERADAAGVKHMAFFTLRWFQHTQFVKELVDAGRVGNPTHCQVSYVHGNGRDPSYRWRMDGERALGILGDLGSHLIDLARWLNGDIVRVAANLSSFVQRYHEDGRPVMPSNDAALLNVEFANGSQGMIHTSTVAYTGGRGLEQHISLYGDQGTVEADLNFANFGRGGAFMAVRAASTPDGKFVELGIPDHIWGVVPRDESTEVFNRMPAGDRYFIDCIVNDLPVTPSLWDGVAVQEVIEAALESQRSGQWVNVRPL
jgi:predicted dehydrogenase